MRQSMKIESAQKAKKRKEILRDDEFSDDISGDSGDEVAREIEKIQAAHMKKIIELVQKEMGVMKREVMKALKGRRGAGPGDRGRGSGIRSHGGVGQNIIRSAGKVGEKENSWLASEITGKNVEGDLDGGEETVNVNEISSNEEDAWEGNNDDGENKADDRGECQLTQGMGESDESSKDSANNCEDGFKGDVEETTKDEEAGASLQNLPEEDIGGPNMADESSEDGRITEETKGDGDGMERGYEDDGDSDGNSKAEELVEVSKVYGDGTKMGYEADGVATSDKCVDGGKEFETEEDGIGTLDGYEEAKQLVDADAPTEITNQTSMATTIKKGGRENRNADNTRTYVRRSKSKRLKRNPTRFGQEETLKGENSKIGMESSKLESVDIDTKNAFKGKLAAYRGKEYIVNGHTVEKTFFKQIYTPKNHVTSHHIETMLSLVWRRIGESLQGKRVAVLDTWFTRILGTEHARYKKLKKGTGLTGTFNWNNTIRTYVRGNVASRSGRLAWIVNVDVVYVPMNWPPNHWVAVGINLQKGEIIILDPLVVHTADSKLPNLMKPLTELLPPIMKELVKTADSSYDPPEKFEYHRNLNVSQNSRIGDCGPLSVRFIELHSQGLSVDDITDKMVDDLRMQYAIDVYEEFVVPL